MEIKITYWWLWGIARCLVLWTLWRDALGEVGNGDLQDTSSRRRIFLDTFVWETISVAAKHLASSVLIEAVGNFIACLGRAAIEQSDLWNASAKCCQIVVNTALPSSILSYTHIHLRSHVEHSSMPVEEVTRLGHALVCIYTTFIGE